MLLATGCQVLNGGDINDNPDAGSRQEQFDVLLKRPDIEQITRSYQQLITEIRKETVDRFGLPGWEFGKDDQTSNSACGFEFPDIHVRDGQERGVNGGYSRAKLPDEDWQEALDVVAQLARAKGFSKGPEVLIDRAGEHVVEFYDT